MHVKNFMIGIIAAAGITQMASAGANFTASSTTGGNWNDGRTWGGSLQNDPVPGLNDHAYIGNGKSVTVNVDVTVGFLDVSNGGSVTVASNKTLTLDGSITSGATANSGPGGIPFQFVAGDIFLPNAGSTVRFSSVTQLLYDNSAGTGKITMSEDDSGNSYANPAAVKIDSGLTLRNRIIMRGQGRIQETSGIATLLNEQVDATIGAVIEAYQAAGRLDLSPGLELLEDKATVSSVDYWPQYRVNTSSSAVLQFAYNGATMSLHGDLFVDDCATIEIVGGADFFTAGSLRMSDGHVDVDCSSQFEWAGTGDETPIGPISCDTVDAGSC